MNERLHPLCSFLRFGVFVDGPGVVKGARSKTLLFPGQVKAEDHCRVNELCMDFAQTTILRLIAVPMPKFLGAFHVQVGADYRSASIGVIVIFLQARILSELAIRRVESVTIVH